MNTRARRNDAFLPFINSSITVAVPRIQHTKNPVAEPPLRRMAECGREMKPDLYSVPVDIDKAVATRKLTALGVSIDVLSEEQKAYLGV